MNRYFFGTIWLANTTLTGPYNSFSAIHTSHHQQQMNYTPPPTTSSISGVENFIARQQGVQVSVVNTTNNNIHHPDQNPTTVTVTG